MTNLEREKALALQLMSLKKVGKIPKLNQTFPVSQRNMPTFYLMNIN